MNSTFLMSKCQVSVSGNCLPTQSLQFIQLCSLHTTAVSNVTDGASWQGPSLFEKVTWGYGFVFSFQCEYSTPHHTQICRRWATQNNHMNIVYGRSTGPLNVLQEWIASREFSPHSNPEPAKDYFSIVKSCGNQNEHSSHLHLWLCHASEVLLLV